MRENYQLTPFVNAGVGVLVVDAVVCKKGVVKVVELFSLHYHGVMEVEKLVPVVDLLGKKISRVGLAIDVADGNDRIGHGFMNFWLL